MCVSLRGNSDFWNLQSTVVSLTAAILGSAMTPDQSTSISGILPGALRARMPGSAARPNLKLVAATRRRQFSIGEKRAFLADSDRCEAASTPGAFLRSKRIDSSTISSYWKQVEAATQPPDPEDPWPEVRSNSPTDRAFEPRYRAPAPQPQTGGADH